MAFICDAHVHLYPEYSLSNSFESALRNLARLSPRSISEDSIIKACCLTERFDCHFFQRLSEGEIEAKDGSFGISSGPEQGSLLVSMPGQYDLLLFSGRQIATSERLELLALTVDADLPDGKSFQETHSKILEAGGIPVLNWAPGKWLFERKKLVQDIIANAKTGDLLICDTGLRPGLWFEPLLMRRAKRSGIKVIAGSDPLPVRGEERRIGTYGIFSDEEFEQDKPVTSFRRLLRQPALSLDIEGQRLSTLAVVSRLLAYYGKKRIS